MRIYWSDREGKTPPPNATFQFHTFNNKKITGPFIQAPLPAPTRAKILKKTFLPTREEWIAKVEQALHLIHNKQIEKVVLARTCILELDHTPDPFALTAALKQKAQGAFVFCLQTDNFAFFGATPERLYTRNGRRILSEALAGTRRRGQNPTQDQQLQNDLLSSSKDLLEFAHIPAFFHHTLSPLCQTPLTFSPISIHQTQNVQHLYSRCSGKLKDTVTDNEILSSLHPTPALCGTPKQKAFSLIEELEPFDRGLYGGALTWSTPEASETIVGIRSCLLEGNKATLFSGTGIVEGSNPEEEWEELNDKLKIYNGIFMSENNPIC